MNRLFIVIALFVALIATPGFARVAPETVEISGTVERWFAADRTILVAGKRYRLTEDVEILDGNGKALDSSALRSGVRVLLIESGGEVGSVVINPSGQSSAIRPTTR